MRFFLLLSFLLLTVLVVAKPEAAPVPEPQSDIKEKLEGIGDLLNGETLRQIQSVLKHADQLLDDESTPITKNLLLTAGPVVTPELLKKVGTLLDNAGGLLTKEFVDQTKNLIAKAGKLLDTVDSLLGALGL
ncbi:hypothetical protein AJ79_01237 [Helicocarpus griseus UAMH5409]|uniref:Uncharacterized protein n=1 Tax=Helicocarpus griseus UAMH5409 TaxID=1447875 RepID=A0A2B7Y8J1_9EURO|nr:hypothetical protein AJ79_01237 [Helicocarpus griseus UAMH5409]